jgi:hypothetical protein
MKSFFQNALGVVMIFLCSSCNFNEYKCILDPCDTETGKVATVPFSKQLNIGAVVTDSNGTVLPGASVFINDVYRGVTDRQGRFVFDTLATDAGQQFRLRFSYEGFVSQSRSYHTQMGNENFMVAMKPPKECCIRKDTSDCGNWPAEHLMFIGGRNVVLGSDIENLLDNIARKLKEKPNCIVILTTNAKSKGYDALAQKRIRKIEAYLVGKGITESRIIANIIEGENSDVIQISFDKR